MRISVLPILVAVFTLPAWTGCSRSDPGEAEAPQQARAAASSANASAPADQQPAGDAASDPSASASESESGSASGTDAMNSESDQKQYPVQKSEAEWKQELTPEQYRILRKQGTEKAFTGEYWDEKQPGTYVCAGCGQPLYSSGTKFESGTGWPSFYQPVDAENVETREDRSWFSVRTEVLCSRCGGHLGHVFDDGPEPTGKRHCINSAALKLVENEDEKQQNQQ